MNKVMYKANKSSTGLATNRNNLSLSLLDKSFKKGHIAMSNYKLSFATLTLVGLTILSGLVLSSSLVSADDVVDEINITVPVSCTLSGTGMNSHNAEINNGTYNSAIGETTLKAFCNDNSGFAIYAVGYTDNEEGKNVLTNSTLGSTHDIATGTATSGTDSNWAMKLSTIASPTPTYPIIIAGTTDDTLKEQGDPDFSTFQEVPDDYTKVAYRTANTDIGTSAEGSTLKTTYQAYISSTQPAGTYTGQVKYTLVHPYNAAAPQKPVSIDTATTLQEVNICSDALTIGQVYTLIDSRDSTSYHVGKLADGNCWLLDNLALDPTDPTTASNMDETNTNASAVAITNFLNGGNSSNNAGWSSSAVADVDTGFNSYTAPMVNNSEKDTLKDGFYGPAAINNQSKVGLYYNFCAASMGTYCYESNQGLDSIGTIEDICPANWRMPNGGEYTSLVSHYSYRNPNESDSLQYNLSIGSTGSYYNNGVWATMGRWWSSSFETNMKKYTAALTMNADLGGFTIDVFGHERSYGFTIRCLVAP